MPQGGFVEAGGAQVWSTYTTIHLPPPPTPPAAAALAAEAESSVALDQLSSSASSSFTSHHVLSIDVNGSFWIDTSRDLYPGFDNTSTTALYLWAHELSRCINGSSALDSGCAARHLPALDDSHRSLFHATDSHRWSLLHIIPVLPNGWAFLGELSKWVPTSSQRFVAVDAYGCVYN